MKICLSWPVEKNPLVKMLLHCRQIRLELSTLFSVVQNLSATNLQIGRLQMLQK